MSAISFTKTTAQGRPSSGRRSRTWSACHIAFRQNLQLSRIVRRPCSPRNSLRFGCSASVRLNCKTPTLLCGKPDRPRPSSKAAWRSLMGCAWHRSTRCSGSAIRFDVALGQPDTARPKLTEVLGCRRFACAASKRLRWEWSLQSSARRITFLVGFAPKQWR